MSSSDGRGWVFRKSNSPNERESRVQLFPASSELRLTLALKSLRELLTHSDSPFPISSFNQKTIAWTMPSSPLVSMAEMQSLSTHGKSSPQSTKQRAGKSNDTAAPGDRLWSVKFHSQVARTIVAHGGPNSKAFRPMISKLIDELERHPKRFPKKKGVLEDARSAELIFADGVAWRAVFTLDARTHVVKVLALGPHDAAYRDAKHRL